MAGKIYSAGIYARLSVEGDDRKNESIENQIEVAKSFLKESSDIVLYNSYTDLGKTGTNFARAGFEQMMQDVRSRRIDCIIVKDLSRFGRNHIEMGNYIEKIFPFMGVRFIAVTDHYDSMNVSGSNETMSVNLKNLINEMYAKDIALKVITSKKAKWEQGSYTGGLPPYGYRTEWTNGRKCLFIEENTANIIKTIYQLTLAGKNRREISEWLYECEIHSPNDYRATGHVYRQENETLHQWPKATIKQILKNPVYIGSLVQGRTCGKDYQKRVKHDIDRSDWSIKEHNHEAIIDENVFFQVSEQFERASIYYKGNDYSQIPAEENIFFDVLFCGECSSRMRRNSSIKEFAAGNKVRIYSYFCPSSNRIDESGCEKKHITFVTLSNIVRTAIKQEFALSRMRAKDLVECNRHEARRLKKDWNRQLADIEKKVDIIKKRNSEAYLKYRMNEITVDAFQKVRDENELQMLDLQKNQIKITGMLNRIDAETEQKNHFLRSLLKFKDNQLTKEVVNVLISRIEVYPDKRVKIIFSFTRKEVV